ncbi:MAG: transketolase family protein [Candidatus Woesearchaeota archaeon]|jgi:transketolase|nr:transketolase family protein [Candidatus Woesearchaeota archaeon]MDP7506050.1 transketolase family protein [Candidatus Woesearchaeota archaeon]MDP7610516.1 transketolase family protein [Candidatus Woesearchaeota archaeon]|tara:strand:+ start:518 stop:1444 length:927 start_codon:yes stop_codon:yes gene_type:complete
MEQLATRDGFGNALTKLGEDKRIVVLDADLSESTRSKKFKDLYPDRFFNMGVSEQDMIGTAAGLAISGKVPFACTFAVFATGRVYDQIRVSVAYSNANVKIIGTHAGLLTGEDGASHQALEDVALMRALPNMTVIQPADALEAEKAVEAIIKHEGPVYLRLGRAKIPTITSENQEFEIGKGTVLKEGSDITIIASGIMVHKALEATELLEQENIKAKVINIHTLKPIDKELIINSAKQTKAIITVEDHSVIGGLGSAVAEVLSENHPTKLKRIGVQDKFGESGSSDELYKKYNMDVEDIVKAAKELNN